MKEEYCEHCGAKMTAYEQRLSKGLVITLLKLRTAVRSQEMNDVHVPSLKTLTKTEFNNFQKLRYHAMVAHVTEAGKDVAGRWLITKRGAQFLKGEVKVPEHVVTFRNKITAKSTKKIWIGDILSLDEQPVWDRKDEYVFNQLTIFSNQ